MQALQLDDIAPDFEAESTEGMIHFYPWIGASWSILFFYPANFSPVCATELGVLAQLHFEFKVRNTKVIAVNVDEISSHKKWIKDINHTQQTRINYPIIADTNKKVVAAYGIFLPHKNNNFAVRSAFIIDPAKKIRSTISYPASTGRSLKEIMRVLDSLQLTDLEGVATPADWELGEEVIILPSITNAEATQRFPKGFREVNSYIRYTTIPTE